MPQRRKGEPPAGPLLREVEGQTVFERVIEALELGSYKKDAAAYAGISESALFVWEARGREHAPGPGEDMSVVPKDERPFVEFSQAIQKAQGLAKRSALQAIRTAWEGTEESPGIWQAAAWYLERTDPAHYGRRLAVKDESDGPAELAVPDSLAEYEDAFRRTQLDGLPEFDPSELLPPGASD